MFYIMHLKTVQFDNCMPTNAEILKLHFTSRLLIYAIPFNCLQIFQDNGKFLNRSIWVSQTNEFDNPDKNFLHHDSKVKVMTIVKYEIQFTHFTSSDFNNPLDVLHHQKDEFVFYIFSLLSELWGVWFLLRCSRIFIIKS